MSERIASLVNLIAEALGTCLPDKSALGSHEDALRRFTDGDRCFMLQVFVFGLSGGEAQVEVHADPRPLPAGCDLALTLMPLAGSGRLAEVSPATVGVSFQSPRPKLAAYCSMMYAARRDPTVQASA